MKKYGIIVEEKLYGLFKNIELFIVLDFYYIYVKGDCNIVFEIDKILMFFLCVNCNLLVFVSFCLKGNLKGNIIDCNE